MTTKKPARHNFKNGLTVRELKEIVKEWPDLNPATGEECEVWIGDKEGTSSQCHSVWPLNIRDHDGEFSADFLLDP